MGKGREEVIVECYVVDSSVVAGRILEDEHLRPEFQEVFDKAVNGEVELVSPDLLVYEIGNILKTSILTKRNTLESAERLFELFFDIPISFIETVFVEVLRWSGNKKLTYYDATYAHLAHKTGNKLLTLDKHLIAFS